jgi:two-component system, LytTR family, response regulator
MNIRTLIVDDEPRARKGIRVRLQEYPDIQIVGECSSGKEAVEVIGALAPDLVFLDIQMPEMNGLEVLQQLSSHPLPLVIFVTAFDKYAIKAFEYHALDYLLKPIDEDRFKKTLQNIYAEFNRRNLQTYAEKLKAMMGDYLRMLGADLEEESIPSVSTANEYISRFMIKTQNHINIISAHDVIWIESAGDLVFLHTKSHKHIYRETMLVLESELDPKKFVRIHRSAIVNIEKVKHLHPVSHGDFDVHLENDVKLRLSRTYRIKFQKTLQRQ